MEIQRWRFFQDWLPARSSSTLIIMLSKTLIFCLLCLSLISACPILERASPPEDGVILSRAAKGKPAQGKAAPPKIEQYTGGGVVENARKANNAPGRVVPKACKKVTDCSCPKPPANAKTTHSTSCINGFCQCDNPVVNLIGDKFIEAVKAIGNAGITKVIAGLMQGLATAKEVVSTIAGAVLGPQARAALKIALLAIPDTSINKDTKGVITKGL